MSWAVGYKGAVKRIYLTALLVSVLHCGGDDEPQNPVLPPVVDAGPDSGLGENPYAGIPVSETVNIKGLHGPVDVVRDRYGMVHIRTTDAVDAVRVEGYQVARDRTMQLELIRRNSTGRLAEVFGDLSSDLVDSDIVMRNIGLHRVAKEMYDALPPNGEARTWLDAYADGISQFNARVVSGDEDLPPGMVLVPRTALAPWTGADVLAVVRFQAMNLSYDADEEIDRSAFVDAVRAKFNSSAVDPLAQKRAGFLNDMVRFSPLDKTTSLPGFPNDTSRTMSAKGPARTAAARSLKAMRVQPGKVKPSDVYAAAQGWQKAMAKVRSLIGGGDRSVVGSNNWVVAPSRTATGHAMLANDPHLTLSSPAVFWMVHINVVSPDPVKALNFAGLSFPGIPGIILGFNENVAWGATTAYFDVSDVYRETLNADKTGVMFKGNSVPFTKVHETIQVNKGAPVDFDVLVVPHHGPVVPTIQNSQVVPPSGTEVLSVKWTGHKPSRDIDAVFSLLRAKNVEDARTSFRDFAVGAQNWVVGGNIFYTAQSQIPKRDKTAYTWNPETFSGTLPCMVQPGDGTAEWTGQFLDEAFVPHVKNPQTGFVATANNDQVGTTLDGDPSNDKLPDGSPMYLSCIYDTGYRVGRIRERIEKAGHPLTLDDMANIQSDARSISGAKLAPKVVAALDKVLAEKATPGTHPDLTVLAADPRFTAANLGEIRTLLAAWADRDYDAASGMNPADNTLATDPNEVLASRATTVFNVWLARMATAVFGDEFAAIGRTGPISLREGLIYVMDTDATKLKTFDAVTGDSSLFDDMSTPAVESRDQRIVLSMLDAIDYLNTKLGADRQTWRWGRLHTVQFASLVFLWNTLSIPTNSDPVFPGGYPRHGDGLNVDVASYRLGRPLSDTRFDYAHGPVQRFVVDLDPKGPVARNVIPGGNVWNAESPHFKDEAEMWRRNQNHPVPFATADVVKEAETRIVFAP